MTEEHLDAVCEIEKASFPRPWLKAHFRDELESPFGYPVVAVMPDGAVAGYLCLKQIFEEAEILNVAVAKSQRGKGIGCILVENALAFSRERGAEVVSLEVRVSNHEAISLYRRLGFRKVGLRKRYYENGEDAILMEHSFSDQIEE